MCDFILDRIMRSLTFRQLTSDMFLHVDGYLFRLWSKSDNQRGAFFAECSHSSKFPTL